MEAKYGSVKARDAINRRLYKGLIHPPRNSVHPPQKLVLNAQRPIPI
ncbi:MAG: hypothetical protein V7K97_04700 [Nostoc sp.]